MSPSILSRVIGERLRKTLRAALRVPGSNVTASDPPLRRALRRVASARETAQSVASVVEDVAFDLRYGVETRTVVPVEAVLGVVGANAQSSRSYVPTRGRHLDRIFPALGLPAGLGFVDIGSGKGLVLLKASQRSFARIIGVEFGENLVEVARNNVDRYRARAGRGAEIELVHADASAWPVADDIHVIYLYNPFEEHILSQVMARVHASAAAAPRPMWIIINHPQVEALITDAGHFQQSGRVRYGSANFVVYQNALARRLAPLRLSPDGKSRRASSSR